MFSMLLSNSKIQISITKEKHLNTCNFFQKYYSHSIKMDISQYPSFWKASRHESGEFLEHCKYNLELWKLTKLELLDQSIRYYMSL